MNTHQQQLLSMCRRALVWRTECPGVSGIIVDAGSFTPAGTNSPATFTTPLTPIGEQFVSLEWAVNDATAAASVHEGLNRTILGYGGQIKLLRKDLISHRMVPVASIARMAIPDVVRMTEAFRVPKVSRKTESLLAAADAMVSAGEEHQAKLLAGGLRADSSEQLRDAASLLKSTVDSRGAAVAIRRGASRTFQEAIVRARKAIDTLTVMIKQQFKDDPSTVESWMQLRRVTKVAVRRPSDTGVPAAPVPATVPAVPATVAATAPGQQSAAA